MINEKDERWEKGRESKKKYQWGIWQARRWHQWSSFEWTDLAPAERQWAARAWASAWSVRRAPASCPRPTSIWADAAWLARVCASRFASSCCACSSPGTRVSRRMEWHCMSSTSICISIYQHFTSPSYNSSPFSHN